VARETHPSLGLALGNPYLANTINILNLNRQQELGQFFFGADSKLFLSSVNRHFPNRLPVVVDGGSGEVL
jgi:hypothetical protein